MKQAATVAVISKWAFLPVLPHLLDVIPPEVEFVAKVRREVGTVAVLQDLLVVGALVEGERPFTRVDSGGGVEGRGVLSGRLQADLDDIEGLAWASLADVSFHRKV